MSVLLHVDADVVMAPRLRTRFHREAERMLNAVALRERRPDLHCALRLCGDAVLRQLTAERPGKGDTVGVLVFPSSGSPGEIVISFEAANRNAKQKGQSLHTELLLLASIAICRLIGYDDSAAEDGDALQARASALRYEALPRTREAGVRAACAFYEPDGSLSPRVTARARDLTAATSRALRAGVGCRCRDQPARGG